MITLTPDEARVLGVLIEKELTTPDQYPLTLNAAVNGSNQKNNRFPVVEFGDDRVDDALQGLRSKGLVVRVDQANSRVPKYRQELTQKLQLNRYELVILAELLLRGPQTLGEVRGRASRMHHLDTIEFVKETLTKLAAREEPLVKELPPSPGSRAERWAQLLAPDAHPLDVPAADTTGTTIAASTPSNRSLTERIEKLEGEVAQLREIVRKLSAALGEGDPFGG